MKDLGKGSKENLRDTLVVAYRLEDQTEVGDDWRARLMQRIRLLEPIPSRTRFFDLFEASFWRFAPVAGVLILILMAAIFQLDFFAEYEMADLLLEDPADFSLSAILET
jgi:hypothetical protein